MLQSVELLQLTAVLEHIETTQLLSVLSVLKTRYQNKLELLPVLLVQQEQFLIKNGQSVVNISIYLDPDFWQIIYLTIKTSHTWVSRYKFT